MAGQRVWIPPDRDVEVQGRRLPGGLYVGESLTSLTGWSAEPALIAPNLPARDRRPDHLGTTMGYWPSYSEISAPARTAYLDWLASGRPGGAYIGYVFLFFYGIERRVLVDAVHLP
ncbi:MAG: TerB N-terminal domain-containing protein, partial [Dehalococcoidia bacterium]